MSFELNINNTNSGYTYTARSNSSSTSSTTSLAKDLKRRYDGVYQQTVKALSEVDFTPEERKEFITNLLKSYKHVYKAASEATTKLQRIKKYSKFIGIDLPQSLITDNTLIFDNPDPEDFKVMAKRHNYYKASLLSRTLINGTKFTESQWLNKNKSDPQNWITDEQYALAFWPIYTKLTYMMTQNKINLNFLVNVGTAKNILQIPIVSATGKYDKGNRKDKQQRGKQQRGKQGKKGKKGKQGRRGKRDGKPPKPDGSILGTALTSGGGTFQTAGRRSRGGKDTRKDSRKGRDQSRERQKKDSRKDQRKQKQDTRKDRDRRNNRQYQDKFSISQATEILNNNNDQTKTDSLTDWKKMETLIASRLNTVFRMNDKDAEQHFNIISKLMSVEGNSAFIKSLAGIDDTSDDNTRKTKLQTEMENALQNLTGDYIKITDLKYEGSGGTISLGEGERKVSFRQRYHLKSIEGTFKDIFNGTEYKLHKILTPKNIYNDLVALCTKGYKPVTINLMKYGEGGDENTELKETILVEIRNRIISGLYEYYRTAKSQTLTLLNRFSETFGVKIDMNTNDSVSNFGNNRNRNGNRNSNNQNRNGAYRGKDPPQNLPNNLNTNNNANNSNGYNKETQNRLDRIKLLMAKYPEGTPKREMLDKMYKNIINKLNKVNKINKVNGSNET